jgi:hypothetical protein
MATDHNNAPIGDPFARDPLKQRNRTGVALNTPLPFYRVTRADFRVSPRLSSPESSDTLKA